METEKVTERDPSLEREIQELKAWASAMTQLGNVQARQVLRLLRAYESANAVFVGER